MKRCIALAILPALLGVFITPARSLRAAPRAASAPATQPAGQIRQWFAELADADAARRDAAWQHLMDLHRQDLPALRDIVEQSRPLAPTQVAALHDVVVQAFLTGESYDADWENGFLGIMQPEFGNESVSVEVPEGQEILPKLPAEPQLEQHPGGGDDADDPHREWGVPVGERLAGFCAYPRLRTGDVVLGLTARREVIERGDNIRQVALPQPAPPADAGGKGLLFCPLRHWGELTERVRRIPAGETVTFIILRQGRIMNVSLELSPRPLVAELGNDSIQAFIAARKTKAELYWQQVFGPLVDSGMS
jgi:hypothetical protein